MLETEHQSSQHIAARMGPCCGCRRWANSTEYRKVETARPGQSKQRYSTTGTESRWRPAKRLPCLATCSSNSSYSQPHLARSRPPPLLGLGHRPLPLPPPPSAAASAPSALPGSLPERCAGPCPGSAAGPAKLRLHWLLLQVRLASPRAHGQRRRALSQGRRGACRTPCCECWQKGAGAGRGATGHPPRSGRRPASPLCLAAGWPVAGWQRGWWGRHEPCQERQSRSEQQSRDSSLHWLRCQVSLLLREAHGRAPLKLLGGSSRVFCCKPCQSVLALDAL